MKMKMMEKKDKLLLVSDSYTLEKFRSYTGLGEYVINIEYLDHKTTHNLNKISKNFSKFALSEKTGEVVFGLANKQLTLFESEESLVPTITKNGGIKINMSHAEREFMGTDVDKIYDYMDYKYFENNDDYKLYDVEKDMLITYLNVFTKVCYDKNNEFLWGKLINNDEDFYFIDTKNLLEIDNERGIKIHNFLESEENN